MTVKTKKKKCANCGKTFVPERSTRQFCTTACRVAYNRAGYSGLDPRDVELLRCSVEALDEFAAYMPVARAEYEAEVKHIKDKMRRATTPYDMEGALEAAERRYWKKLNSFEPRAIRNLGRV